MKEAARSPPKVKISAVFLVSNFSYVLGAHENAATAEVERLSVNLDKTY
jgi:hypothetical protein